ncbi:sensor domain-containing phosphodiesterase [Vibrio atypicus]|uniref:sensor domain-containing phosphodiesterase n=1 Tax=Vibrio atypicus TaxID=558271 RepID=UPI001CEC9C7D|nr:EAL domain-containing protein [Vibrio atypicus]
MNTPLTERSSKWLSYLVIFFMILLGFEISSHFIVDQIKYQIISFVGAVMAVSFLTLQWRAFPVIAAALFTYYFQSGRDPLMAAAFAVTMPILPLLVSTFFLRASRSKLIESGSEQLGLFFLFFGVLIPIGNTLQMFAISAATEKQHLSAQFLFYAMLGTALTHLIVTPLLLFLTSLFTRKNGHRYMLLDSELRNSNQNKWWFPLWLLSCSLLMTIAFSFQNTTTLFSTCLAVFLLVTIGLGKFGVVRPLSVGALVMLTMVYAGVQRVNQIATLDDNFYGLMMVLIVITSLSYLIAGYVLKHHDMLKSQIHAERIDPYTGLFNIGQLKEDIIHHNKIILIYLDLAPTLSKLGDIGHEGKSQLIAQIQQELLDSDSQVGRCYRPPFTLGILGYTHKTKGIKNELKNLTQMLDEFQFYWKGTSISLVDPTLHCIQAGKRSNIQDLVSHLCDQPPISDTKLNWVDEPALEGKVDKLSYIQKAFKNNWFELNCQPYLKLTAGDLERLHSFEVLLRINPENGVRLTPAEFFPLVNQFGLETQLDKWVVHNTFKMLHEQVHEWDKIEKCAINLTAKSLGVSHLAHDILASAKMFEIPLKRICFEITESSALQNEQQAIETITILRNAGCKIALDDFGTGYASFAYLRRLPLDILKVDGEFVKELPTNESDRLIVSSISKVAKEIGLETVAEFVESHEHIEILNSLGITYAQGYGVAKPRPLIHYLHEINEKEALVY